MGHVRRERRLTGTQITVIAVAICVAVVGAPVSVMAATGSLVNITDPVTASYKARVDSGGRLQIGNGTKPLTMTGTVTGTITAVPAVPAAAKHFQLFTTFNASGTAQMISLPAGKGLAITDLVLSASNGSNGENVMIQVVTPTPSGTPCDLSDTFTSPSTLLWAYAPPSGVASISLQSPEMVPASTTARCILLAGGNFGPSDLLTMNLNGYWY